VPVATKSQGNMICASTGTVTLDGVVFSKEMSELAVATLTGSERNVHGTGASYRFETAQWGGVVLFVAGKIETVSMVFTPGHAQSLADWSADDELKRRDEHIAWIRRWFGPAGIPNRREERVFPWGAVSSEVDHWTGDASLVVSYRAQ